MSLKLSLDERVALSHLRGAVRRGQSWFKPPRPTVLKLTAARVAQIHDVPRSRLEHQISQYGVLQDPKPTRYEDFAPQSQSSVDWLNQELKRPSSTLNQGTARFAGYAYHWTQTYDGVLRLAPGASPW